MEIAFNFLDVRMINYVNIPINQERNLPTAKLVWEDFLLGLL